MQQKLKKKKKRKPRAHTEEEKEKKYNIFLLRKWIENRAEPKKRHTSKRCVFIYTISFQLKVVVECYSSCNSDIRVFFLSKTKGKEEIHEHTARKRERETGVQNSIHLNRQTCAVHTLSWIWINAKKMVHWQRTQWRNETRWENEPTNQPASQLTSKIQINR